MVVYDDDSTCDEGESRLKPEYLQESACQGTGGLQGGRHDRSWKSFHVTKPTAAAPNKCNKLTSQA